MSRWKTWTVLAALGLLILSLRGPSLQLSAVGRLAAPFGYNLLTWEIRHLPQKWFNRVTSFFTRNNSSRQERLAKIDEFFRISRKESELRNEITRAAGGVLPFGKDSAADVNRLEELAGLNRQLSHLAPEVEEAIEAEISTALAKEGFRGKTGIIFPPVDLAFDLPPKLVITSPRDRIALQDAIRVNRRMSLQEMERLEDTIEKQLGLSALVDDTGGISFYPSLVPGTYGLHFTVTTGVHEWVHQYLWFYPLGKNYYSTLDTQTLNETVANLVGRELGDRVYQAITGREPPKPAPPSDNKGFDFNAEMRKTRLRVEELLKEGRSDEAEAYMEERRQYLAENGYYIRKLNQAYFAFHETYADSPASISPIHEELKVLRQRSNTVGHFLRTAARFGSYQDFKKYLSDLR